MNGRAPFDPVVLRDRTLQLLNDQDRPERSKVAVFTGLLPLDGETRHLLWKSFEAVDDGLHEMIIASDARLLMIRGFTERMLAEVKPMFASLRESVGIDEHDGIAVLHEVEGHLGVAVNLLRGRHVKDPNGVVAELLRELPEG